MYKIIAVGGKVIATTQTRRDAMIIARQFANTNCTFTKVYNDNVLIAIYS